MKKITVSEKAAYTVSLVMLALFLSVSILAGVLFSVLASTEDDYASYRTEAEIKLSDLEKKKNQMNAKAAELTGQLELAEKTRAELERRIGEAETELRELEESFGNTDELYKRLNDELKALNKSLTEKNEEIAALKQDIDDLSKQSGADLNRQFALLSEIQRLLSEGAPMNRVETPLLHEDGTPIVGADGLPQMEVSYVYPKLSLYYEDIERGYVYRWNADAVYPSSGCEKASFALSVLQAASAEQAEYDRRLAEYIASNGPTEVLPGFTRKYDLGKIFTYTEDKYVAGSGVIKDAEFGVQYTYEELFRMLLLYGDSVAFHELKATYGTTLHTKLLSTLGTTTMKNNTAKASAGDLSLVMKEIYRFTESGAPYTDFMKENLMNSIHTVMIGYGVSPKKIAHHYGWDEGAYHDMAIVYDTHPYVLVIMSDMDGGGDEVNAYWQKVVSLIDDLHESFGGV